LARAGCPFELGSRGDIRDLEHRYYRIKI
jgi:hypothetical protein